MFAAATSQKKLQSRRGLRAHRERLCGVVDAPADLGAFHAAAAPRAVPGRVPRPLPPRVVAVTRQPQTLMQILQSHTRCNLSVHHNCHESWSTSQVLLKVVMRKVWIDKIRSLFVLEHTVDTHAFVVGALRC